MDWFDRKVLLYVLFWASAGGMDDEDVFPEFGMRVDQLNERFNSIVSTMSGCSTKSTPPIVTSCRPARRHQLSGRLTWRPIMGHA